MWPFRNRDIPRFDVESTLAKGTTVRGDVAGPGGFRVDGTLDGSIDSEGAIVVGERGTINGGVKGREVVVLGVVRGDVQAKHLEIGPKGRVLGDISVASLRMHEGGVFRGTSRMSGGEDLATTTHPFGFLADGATPKLESQVESRVEARVEPRVHAKKAEGGRTLPPPVGAVVPPPPASVSAIALAPPAASEDRIVAPPLPTKNVANG